MSEIIPIPAFNDNYIWLYRNGQSAWVVDPGDATPVIQYLQKHNLDLEGIILTHHHLDHTGGVQQLTRENGGQSLPVYGFANSNIRAINHPLHEGDRLSLPGLTMEVMYVPGHTLDHIAYFGDCESTGPVLFCGDTLFAAGCGRLFEGTAEDMLNSLNKFKALPPSTRVYCAHEYTLANLAFARAVMPESEAVQKRINDCSRLRDRDEPTLPSTIAEELASNPFMRTDQPEVIRQAESRSGQPCRNEAEVMGTIRRWKDKF